jgi:glutamate-1-semialdehyde 2,1-aminomutase
VRDAGGARTEFQFTATPPRNGSEADAILDSDMEHIIHLFLLNRGLLITPFHNMLLICPQTTAADVERLVAAFDDFVSAVL